VLAGKAGLIIGAISIKIDIMMWSSLNTKFAWIIIVGFKRRKKHLQKTKNYEISE
jgi:hypothetical protein